MINASEILIFGRVYGSQMITEKSGGRNWKFCGVTIIIFLWQAQSLPSVEQTFLCLIRSMKYGPFELNSPKQSCELNPLPSQRLGNEEALAKYSCSIHTLFHRHHRIHQPRIFPRFEILPSHWRIVGAYRCSQRREPKKIPRRCGEILLRIIAEGKLSRSLSPLPQINSYRLLQPKGASR